MSTDSNWSEDVQRKARRALLIFFSLVLLASLCCGSVVFCLPAWFTDGILVAQCPAGDVRQGVGITASGLRRNQPGSVSLMAVAYYTTGPADEVQSTAVRRFDGELSLVDAQGRETPLEPVDGWDMDSNHQLRGVIQLPEVPDGDYLLRARVDSPIGDSTYDLALPIFAPSRAHVITDRPLYEPGNMVQFRAVALRARDMVPLAHRPGKWVLRGPDLEPLMEEKATTGEWGEVSGSFPLDAEAMSGRWSVIWESGGDSAQADFQVEPFTLPRFRVEASADRGHYRAGDSPLLRGAVIYSSGAPVAGASLELSWSHSGDWPPPTSWQESELPTRLQADANGRYSFRLPAIPADLVGTTTLSARIDAVDPAGERVSSGISLLFSADPIAVSAVTEQGQGLLQGFNNRVYLRATTPEGAALPGVRLQVQRAWDPSSPGEEVLTDADGVAALQFDPGPPVTVVVPPPPLRPPPAPPPVSRGSTHDLRRDAEATLDDQLALDRLLPILHPCARFVEQGESRSRQFVAVRGGRVAAAVGESTPLDRCISAALTGVALGAGPDRALQVDFVVQASDLPRLSAVVTGGPSHSGLVQDRVAAAVLQARSCLPPELPTTELGQSAIWMLRRGSKEISLSWSADEEPGMLSPAAQSCVIAAMQGLSLSEPAGEDALGSLHLSISPSARRQSLAAPQATTMLGYELKITARAGEELIGSTVLRLPPGQVPDLRLRASPVIARGGEKVEVELLRGPGFAGTLPDRLTLTHQAYRSVEAMVDPDTRKASFQLPAEATGWWELRYGQARALVFVPRPDRLELQLQPSLDRAAPGEQVLLGISTQEGGQPVAAAVSLIGVDQSLGQLVALPGPGELDRLNPPVETREPAFGVFDAQALSLGRVSGEHAAAAIVGKVGNLPPLPELETSINAMGLAPFDGNAGLVDSFYTVLGELHLLCRQWEEKTPRDQKMSPVAMAELWDQALEQAEEKGLPHEDPWGRPLRLHQLPSDLLALVDPRVVVLDGTRNPEDVESWTAWVMKEQP